MDTGPNSISKELRTKPDGYHRDRLDKISTEWEINSRVECTRHDVKRYRHNHSFKIDQRERDMQLS